MQMVFTLNEIEGVARKVLELIKNRKVIAFYGQMGTGKTTLIKVLCQVLGVKGLVSSPTYSIINEYEGATGKVLHMDLYRLKDKEEAVQAGVEDSLYSGHLCLVEWPELALSFFPEDAVHIYIEAIDESTRRIRIRG